jgi:hypothetical protein
MPLAATTFLTVKARIARALLELADHIGQNAGAGRIVLQDKIGQGDLAAMAGVARENVSRVMSDWRRRNLVSLSSSSSSRFYCINDRAALADEMGTERLNRRKEAPRGVLRRGRPRASEKLQRL